MYKTNIFGHFSQQSRGHNQLTCQFFVEKTTHDSDKGALLLVSFFPFVNFGVFLYRYLSCVSQTMKKLQPFGDVPKKLTEQLRRSFVASRTFAQALLEGKQIVNKIILFCFQRNGEADPCFKGVGLVTELISRKNQTCFDTDHVQCIQAKRHESVGLTCFPDGIPNR